MLYVPGIFKDKDGQFLANAALARMRQLGADRFDVVDAHFGYPDGVGAALAARRLGLPAFVTIRGHEADYVRHPRIGPILIDTLRSVTGCISVSHSLRDLMVRYGVPRYQIRVIPNAVDRKTFRPRSRSQARSELGIDCDRKMIVSIGTLITLKRHHVALHALAAVRQHHPDILFVIVGAPRDEPTYSDRLLALVRTLGLTDNVRFTGSIPPAAVAHWLSAANAFCLLSAREGCCNAVLEALATGLPVVATAVGDNSQYVHDGRNGYLVPVDDVANTASRLRETLNRDDWDAAQISATLNVGDWDSVGRGVVDFMRERVVTIPS
jgi:glycosyltransferase involved in cell wall biosynthesis